MCAAKYTKMYYWITYFICVLPKLKTHSIPSVFPPQLDTTQERLGSMRVLLTNDLTEPVTREAVEKKIDLVRRILKVMSATIIGFEVSSNRIRLINILL
jgi:hypothetical protein